MLDPVSLTLIAGSTLTNVFGQLEQGRNAKKQANQQADAQLAQAQDLKDQALIQEQNANRVRASAVRVAKNATETVKQTKQAQEAYRGEIRTAYAKSGVTSTGSASMTIEDQLIQDNMKLFNISDTANFDIENALFEATNLNKQATITRRQSQQAIVQAGYTRKAGKDAYRSSLFNAAGTIFGSAGQAYGASNG